MTGLVAAPTPYLVSFLEAFAALLHMRYNSLSFTKSGKVCCSVGGIQSHHYHPFITKSFVPENVYCILFIYFQRVGMGMGVCRVCKHVEASETACWSHFSPTTSLLYEPVHEHQHRIISVLCKFSRSLP